MYDEDRGVILLYGGVGDGESYHDTWVFDGSSWSEMKPATQPSYSRASMAYDPSRGLVVAFSNHSGVAGNETFTWDGSNWSEQESPERPAPRYASAVAYQPDAQGVVLFGGVGGGEEFDDTWIWADTWSQVFPETSPPARQGHQMVYDQISGNVLLNGGCQVGLVDGIFKCSAELKDTWGFHNGDWTLLDDGSSLKDVPLMDFAFGYDPERGVVVRYGGYDYNNFTVKSDWLYEWREAWDFLPGLATPSRRMGANLAYHPEQGGLVLFGGIGSGAFYDETWRYGCL